MHFGIDYGANLAGTTAVCFKEQDKLLLSCSKKKKNADLFLTEMMVKYQPNLVFIDAPLSLPKAYYGDGNDFHFRKADRLTQAMSPMFLGGLTARAIALKSAHQSIKFYETYPKMLIKNTPSIGQHYNKKTKLREEIIAVLADILPFALAEKPKNWHEFDAIIAWYSGYRFLNEEAEIFGDPSEGRIIV